MPPISLPNTSLDKCQHAIPSSLLPHMLKEHAHMHACRWVCQCKIHTHMHSLARTYSPHNPNKLVGVMLGCCTARRAVQSSLLTHAQRVHMSGRSSSRSCCSRYNSSCKDCSAISPGIGATLFPAPLINTPFQSHTYNFSPLLLPLLYTDSVLST